MQLQSRKIELTSIIRYKQNPVCKPMMYTTNVWIHVERVIWISENICKSLSLSEELTQKIIRRAMFHDDTEIITWDYATPEKQSWSKEKIEKYEQECENAIPLLVGAYERELWSDYEKILYEVEGVQQWDSLVHSIIEYADKLDALMETFHELSSGSTGFLSSMKKHFGKDMTCWEYIITRVQKRYSKLQEIYWKPFPNTWILNLEQIRMIDIQKVVSNWRNHTIDSVEQRTGIELYDTWKDLHFINGTPEHIKYLYTQNIT